MIEMRDHCYNETDCNMKIKGSPSLIHARDLAHASVTDVTSTNMH
ncbi:hypothetical protein FKM82_018133 [Ascaphus truei]